MENQVQVRRTYTPPHTCVFRYRLSLEGPYCTVLLPQTVQYCTVQYCRIFSMVCLCCVVSDQQAQDRLATGGACTRGTRTSAAPPSSARWR